ncbi:MAG: hypothetical protein JXA22_10500 [Candidatus Thermoplasmatota archaeon]|nr:hypothetical protein [Candidatus Thermoplasmatota archaeon]
MSGRRNTWRTPSLVLFLVLVLVCPLNISGGGPTRSSGTDIAVMGITSHTDGSKVGMEQQTVTALVRNEGTDAFSPHVNATLEVYYPVDGPGAAMVFSNTTYLGAVLTTPGSQTSVIFPDWMPVDMGYYAINVSVDAEDDHLWNNSINITIEVLSGKPVDLSIDVVGEDRKVIKAGESTNDAPNTPFVFRVRNDGISADTFEINVEGSWLLPGWVNTTGVVQPGEWSAPLFVHATVPDNASGSDFDIIVLTAISTNDPAVQKKRAVEIRTYSSGGVLVFVSSKNPMTAYPGGDPVNFDFIVRNTGGKTDDFTLEVRSRPSNWIVELRSSPIIRALEPGHEAMARARIRIPPLNYDTMEEDNVLRGDTGAMIMKASGLRYYAESTGEGIVVVGLVHTVLMEVDPPNTTIKWSLDAEKNVSFALNVTSVNNIRNGKGVEMDVNLSLPEGPYGVFFYSMWDPGRYNDTESKRWTAGVGPKTLHLESGETSYGSRVDVTAPPFPFQGTAVTVVEAIPLLGYLADGLALPAREYVKVFVKPEIQFTVEPPRTEYFEEYRNGSKVVDADYNSVPDWQEGAPGDVLLLPFNITNTGNTADFYDIYADAIPRQPASTLPDDWDVAYQRLTNEMVPFWYDPLGDRHSTLAWVAVRVPDGAPIGEVTEVKIQVTSIMSRDSSYRLEPLTIEASIDIYVIQGFGLDLEPEESQGYAEPDETIEYRLNLTNVGNGMDQVLFIPMIDELSGWEVEFNVTDIRIAPLERFTVTLFVTPSGEASADDSLAVRVRAQSLISPSTYDDVWINTTVEYVGGVDLRLVSTEQMIWRYPGEIATFRLSLTNTGNGDDDFEVDLDIGAERWAGIIDSGTDQGPMAVMSIPKGQTRNFIVNISLPSLFQVNGYEDLEDLDIIADTKVANNISVSPRGDVSVVATKELAVGVLQQYRADIDLASGEARSRDVLVGEAAVFRLVLRNIGNGNDMITAIHTSSTQSFRQLSWTFMDPGPYDMVPFQEKEVDLTLEPDPEGLPLYGERIYLTVEAVAGNGVTYRRTNITGQIVLSRILSEYPEMDLGTEGEIVLRICNMPAPGSTPRLGFPDQKSFTLSSNIDTQTVTGQGWYLPNPSFDVTLIDLYQIGDVSIPVKAPSELMTGSEYASVDIELTGMNGMLSTHRTVARAVYFDAAIDVTSTRFQNLYESRTGTVYIRIVTSGTRGQEVIPVVVMVGGDVIGRFNAGPVTPQDFGNHEQEVIFPVDFELPTLKWYEKGKVIELRVIVDPEDIVIENNIQGREVSESNNVLSKDFVIKNYTPNVAVLVLIGLLLLFAAAAGVIGFFYLDRRNSWYLIPLSIGLSGLFSMLFYVPLEEASSGLNVANIFGLAIIAIDIFFIMPVMVYLYTRAGDPYIVHLINVRRGREVMDGQEVTTTSLKPLLISLLGGLLIILIPALIWVIPSEMNRGLEGVLGAFFGFNGTIPIWVPVLIIPALAVGLQFLLLQLKRSALTGIEKAWDSLDRLRAEIEEGLR